MNAPTTIAFRSKLERSTSSCPVCNGPAFIRTSEEVTALVKDLHIHCGNTDCGHTWKAQLMFVYTISPSALPDPLGLPQCPPEYRRTIFSKDAPPDPNQLDIFADTG